jgi:hypothetical protein
VIALLVSLSFAAPLLQSGAEDRVRAAVATYVSPRTKAEDRAKIVERLGSMGPAAVGFTQAAADVATGGAHLPSRFLAGEVKVDLLKRIGDESGADILMRLRAHTGTLDLSERPLESVLDELRRKGIPPVVINPLEQEEISKLRFTVRANGEAVDHILDRVLHKHRLDYYARGSVIVIASRAWLWGLPAPASADATVQARISEALVQLDSDTIDRRAAAERSIIETGPAAVPILEAEHGKATGAKRERLAVLVDRILARHVPDRLHPVDAEPGMLGEEAQEYYKTAKERLVSISFFRPTTLAEIVAKIGEFSEIAIATDQLPPAIANRKLTLAVDRAPLQEVLEALVVPLGAAVRPEAGKLVLAARR